MKSYHIVLFLLPLTTFLFFTSCGEEEKQEEIDFALPNAPTALPESAKIDADELLGINYRMSSINFFNSDNDEKATFNLIFTTFMVEEANCTSAAQNCIASLTEREETLRFGNTILTATSTDGHDKIRFHKIDGVTTSDPDEWVLQYLENEIYSIFAGAQFDVYQQGDIAYLRCLDCPISYEGVTYNNRLITLSPV